VLEMLFVLMDIITPKDFASNLVENYNNMDLLVQQMVQQMI